MPGPVTIKHIAAQLGISHSTVSRALADHPRTSAATKARVRAAARNLGYVAHSAARTMRGRRSALAGLLLPDIRNDFYAIVAKAMAETCNRAGLQLVLAITEDDPDTENRQVRELSEARAAGIVLVPSPAPTRETRTLLRRAPLVQLVRRCPGLDSDWMGIDDQAAIGSAVRHLLSLGHVRMGYVGGFKSLSTGSSRLRAYRATLADAGVECDESLVRTGPPRAGFGREAARALLAVPKPPTAIVTGGLRIAIGVLQAVRDADVRVPEELSLVGFGDGTPFQWWGKGMTTIQLPARDLATAAADLLVRRVREERKGDQPRTDGAVVLYQSKLIVRGSTAAPAGPSAHRGESGIATIGRSTPHMP